MKVKRSGHTFFPSGLKWIQRLPFSMKPALFWFPIKFPHRFQFILRWRVRLLWSYRFPPLLRLSGFYHRWGQQEPAVDTRFCVSWSCFRNICDLHVCWPICFPVLGQRANQSTEECYQDNCKSSLENQIGRATSVNRMAHIISLPFTQLSKGVSC